MIYILRFGQWIKVGWTDCWPRRAARGFWHLVHPTTEEFGELGLCKRLDDYEVLHIFDGGTKGYEEKLNKSMPWVGEFHLEVFSLPWVLEALREHLQELPLPVGKIECEIPVPRECCGGSVHRCFACEPPKKFARRDKLTRHMRNIHGR